MVNKLYDLAVMQPQVPPVHPGPLPGPHRPGGGLHRLRELRERCRLRRHGHPADEKVKELRLL